MPVLHEGRIPEMAPDKWTLRLFGAVQQERTVAYPEFLVLPRVKVLSDIHCVTSWTLLDNLWEGVAAADLVKLVALKPQAKFVLVHACHGYSANLVLADLLQPDVLFAIKHNGQNLEPAHGFPLRLVVPRLYFWKSVKWVTGLEFLAEERLGFWESRGYHPHGDPWKEERYSR